MIMPNCRIDKTYNFDFLNRGDQNFVEGYDCAVREAIDCFFDNLEVYLDDDVVKHLSEKNDARDSLADKIRKAMLAWAESQRDEIIVSMIDSMDEAEYEANRIRAFSSEKKYFDTRGRCCP